MNFLPNQSINFCQEWPTPLNIFLLIHLTQHSVASDLFYKRDMCLFPAKISIILNAFWARLPFYETLELHAQLGLENIPYSRVCQIFSNIHILISLLHLRFLQLLSNLSLYNGSKGALLIFGVLCSYLVHYYVGRRITVLWQRSTKQFCRLKSWSY